MQNKQYSLKKKWENSLTSTKKKPQNMLTSCKMYKIPLYEKESSIIKLTRNVVNFRIETTKTILVL